ncbi:698_t:CDS:1 [Dentiscutata heterogama]|uniref:698_t:CDS:1 n=1 Tax=Dentiscutata heterogama TaxID=1316150 RepID=A0ACA9MEU3_9GLOM|nr:698_t:CDS:1 [Dentiscutata heterogama]
MFITKVWPFRRLLPDNLTEDVLRCHLVSGAAPLYNVFPARSCSKIDSVIINKEILQLFTKWINKNSKEILYEFNLLFRSSRDGFSSYTFHQKCDNKGATIVVGKISNSNQLVGGYNPLDWNGNGQYKNTTDSFLFSISDLKNATLGRVTYGHQAVYCNNNYGPTFGAHDLYAPNNNSNWQYNVVYYSSINLSGSVTISNYEVFQVVKKISLSLTFKSVISAFY